MRNLLEKLTRAGVATVAIATSGPLEAPKVNAQENQPFQMGQFDRKTLSANSVLMGDSVIYLPEKKELFDKGEGNQETGGYLIVRKGDVDVETPFAGSGRTYTEPVSDDAVNKDLRGMTEFGCDTSDGDGCDNVTVTEVDNGAVVKQTKINRGETYQSGFVQEKAAVPAPTAVPYEAPKTSGYDFVGEKPYPTALPRAEALKQSEAAGIDHQAQPGEIVFVMRNSIVQGDVVTVDQNGKIVTNITDTDPDTCDIVIFNKDAKVELPYGGNITYYGNEPNPITLGSGLGRFTLEAIEHGGENNQGCKTVIVKQSP